MPPPRPASSSALKATLAMLGIVAVPAAITLHTVRTSTLHPDYTAASSPHGYTISLLLFIVPAVAIAFWFLPGEDLIISKKSFGWTIGLLFPLGAALDFFFARYFFLFPNAGATLEIKAPALGGGVPAEEYVFYLTGFLTVVLLYIWFDEYWLSAYSIPSDPEASATRITFDRLLRFHPASLIFAVALIVGAILYRKLAIADPGFPGYFTFLVLVAMLPSTMLLPAALPVINWRALSLTMFIIILTSLLWEVTLALPYGWWNFNDAQLIGIRITAWAFLPIEEVFLWVAVTYASVIVYEIVRRWKASGRTAKHAFLGRQAPAIPPLAQAGFGESR